METTNHLFGLPGLCGIMFAVGGILLCFFPPKKIDGLYGYRTMASMKSPERWKFAQKFAAIRMVLSVIFLGLISLSGLLFSVGHAPELILGIALALLSVFYVLFATEKALKNKFPTD